MDLQTAKPEEEYVTRCVVDTSLRKVYLYSNEGDEKVVDCDTMDEFLNLLRFLRDHLDEETLVYADPVVAS